MANSIYWHNGSVHYVLTDKWEIREMKTNIWK